MLDFIKTSFHNLIREVQVSTYRYLYKDFNLKNRITGLIGPRGVGKTTLMLQFIKNNLYDARKVFYFSADNVYFNNSSLLEFIVNMYHTEGMEIFFIDEVHKYANWQQELKNIYDAFPAIKLVFSGSSSIDLVKGGYDLSRRANLFYLHGLSLREYINFSTNSAIAPVSYDDLIASSNKFDAPFAQIPQIKGRFQQYLKLGYYPFLFEDEGSYYGKLLRIVEKTIHEDIANYYNLKTANLGYFKRILNYLASSLPGNISTNNLAQGLNIDHKTAANYLHILAESGLIRLLYAASSGGKVLRKPEKAFLHNTTLLSLLAENMSPSDPTGVMRELFFVQSCIDAGLNVFYSNLGDFQIQDTIFEIGGKNKTRQQLKSKSNAMAANAKIILVKDSIMMTESGAIPLYYFGFLY